MLPRRRAVGVEQKHKTHEGRLLGGNHVAIILLPAELSKLNPGHVLERALSQMARPGDGRRTGQDGFKAHTVQRIERRCVLALQQAC